MKKLLLLSITLLMCSPLMADTHHTYAGFIRMVEETQAFAWENIVAVGFGFLSMVYIGYKKIQVTSLTVGGSMLAAFCSGILLALFGSTMWLLFWYPFVGWMLAWMINAVWEQFNDVSPSSAVAREYGFVGVVGASGWIGGASVAEHVPMLAVNYVIMCALGALLGWHLSNVIARRSIVT